MKTLKALSAVVIAAAAVWWGISSHQETERQKAIVNEVKHLVAVCKTNQSSDAIEVHGQALVWDMAANSRSNAYSRVPPDLKASSADGRVTVFMIMGERDVKVGTYSISGQPAYRRYVDICVAYWPEKKVAGMGSVVSQAPRSRRPVQQRPEYGDPNEPIANWIVGLPRDRKS